MKGATKEAEKDNAKRRKRELQRKRENVDSEGMKGRSERRDGEH